MKRHIVGGRNAATIAASMLVTVGSALPAVRAEATTVRSVGSGCARSVRGDINALQPREVAGACVLAGAAGGARAGVPQAPRTAATTCVTVPGVNDRCAKWMTPDDDYYTSYPLQLTSPASDGRVYHVFEGGSSDINVLSAVAYGPDGRKLWRTSHPGLTYTPQGSTTAVSGSVIPTAATMSPDGSRLYVAAALAFMPPTGDPACGYQGLLVAYWAATGQQLWSVSDAELAQPCSAFYTSMVADSNHLYVAAGSTVPPNNSTEETIAFDAVTGAVAWQLTFPHLIGFNGWWPIPDGSYGVPVVTESHDGKAVLLLMYTLDVDSDNVRKDILNVLSLNPGSGSRQWFSRDNLCPTCATDIGDTPFLRPVIDDSHFYYHIDIGIANLPTSKFPNGVVTYAHLLVARKISNGAQSWSVDDSQPPNDPNSGVPTWLGADPATQMVYEAHEASVSADALVAYHSADGSQAWSINTIAVTGGALVQGVDLLRGGAHIVLVGYITALYNAHGEVLSLDATTGAVAWRALLSAAVDDSGGTESVAEEPAIVSSDSQHVVIHGTYTPTGTCAASGGCGVGIGTWAFDAS